MSVTLSLLRSRRWYREVCYLRKATQHGWIELRRMFCACAIDILGGRRDAGDVEAVSTHDRVPTAGSNFTPDNAGLRPDGIVLHIQVMSRRPVVADDFKIEIIERLP